MYNKNYNLPESKSILSSSRSYSLLDYFGTSIEVVNGRSLYGGGARSFGCTHGILYAPEPFKTSL
jgi:hypothetical protein